MLASPRDSLDARGLSSGTPAFSASRKEDSGGQVWGRGVFVVWRENPESSGGFQDEATLIELIELAVFTPGPPVAPGDTNRRPVLTAQRRRLLSMKTGFTKAPSGAAARGPGQEEDQSREANIKEPKERATFPSEQTAPLHTSKEEGSKS